MVYLHVFIRKGVSFRRGESNKISKTLQEGGGVIFLEGGLMNQKYYKRGVLNFDTLQWFVRGELVKLTKKHIFKSLSRTTIWYQFGVWSLKSLGVICINKALQMRPDLKVLQEGDLNRRGGLTKSQKRYKRGGLTNPKSYKRGVSSNMGGRVLLLRGSSLGSFTYC